ncbi:MAG: single-stranded-DNA-specific exonuclease RecJ [Chloroflexi bacterium]|nr:single-stranded-DNA-specific exonuclease RecJ [Chloroflexota bacterium]
MTSSSQARIWKVFPPLPPQVQNEFEIFPKYLSQILYNRGIADRASAEEYLEASASLGDPFLLLDMEKTVDRLLKAIDDQEAIAVYGDYDVDGVTATALMVVALQRMNAKVLRFIPNRFEDGYGLNNESITILADSGVRVILTVDCGIRSFCEADHARKLGVDLIISDHHHPKKELPDAFAVICPKREADPYPYKELAGVGLAFKIVQAMRLKRPMDFLDLVALGTVADVVPLTGENRVLVRRGIQQIRFGKRVGIKALAGAAGKEYSRISANDIGYILGPRLNAAGRMDSAIKSYDLLVTESIDKAGLLAQELDNQNIERQKATRVAQELAKTNIGEDYNGNLITAFYKVPIQEDPDGQNGGFLIGEEVYPGIVGLVAAKLTEYFYRPSIVGVVEGEFVRASCRSIPEFHITNALDQCADLLERHGGHAMAAGFTVHRDQFSELITRLSSIADDELGGKGIRQTIKVDLEMDIKEIHPAIYHELEKLQPTGMGNSAASFVIRGAKILRMELMGKERPQTHLRIWIDGCPINPAVAFHQAQWFQTWRESKPKFDILFSIEINRFFEKETQQINIRDMRVSDPSEP